MFIFYYHFIGAILFTGVKYQKGIESIQQHTIDIVDYSKRRISHFPSGAGMQRPGSYVVVVRVVEDEIKVLISKLKTERRETR